MKNKSQRKWENFTSLIIEQSMGFFVFYMKKKPVVGFDHDTNMQIILQLNKLWISLDKIICFVNITFDWNVAFCLLIIFIRLTINTRATSIENIKTFPKFNWIVLKSKIRATNMNCKIFIALVVVAVMAVNSSASDVLLESEELGEFFSSSLHFDISIFEFFIIKQIDLNKHR